MSLSNKNLKSFKITDLENIYNIPQIANEYTQQPYNIGDYVNYQGVIYRCTTQISVSESWNSNHWTSVMLADDVRDNYNDLKSALDETTYRKNLFDKEHPNIINAAPTTSAPLKYSSNSNARTVWIECKPNTTYTVSKQAGTRFTVAYGALIPEINAEIEYSWSYHENSSITITTSSTAKYLGAFVWMSTTDVITLEQMLATIQIEESNTATSYEPYSLSANDKYARNEIDNIQSALDGMGDIVQSKKVIISPTVKTAVLGDEMIANFSSMMAIGDALYSNGVWDLPINGGISTSLTVEANTTYLIDLGIVTGSVVISDYSTNLKVNPLVITIGDASLSIFANGDANWKLCLTPTVSGSATLSIVCEDLLSLKMESLSVKPVTSLVDIPLTISNIDAYMNLRNIALGNGLKKRITGDYNTAIGINSQRDVNTGFANTAVGYNSQLSLKNGRANCAIGNNAQRDLTTGMYNNAMGTVAQGYITSGCWNNAIGNEAQRDLTSGHNNTGIGRRAQSYLTIGCENTAFGSLAAFTQINGHGLHGGYATKTANYQTLIGAESIQSDSTNGEHDYATALGYKTYVGTKALALGAKAEATGENSVAIGYGVHATQDHEIVIGNGDSMIVIAGKRITFNQDGTVTWTSV